MKLLVAIDFSELAVRIIAEAEKLAGSLHAQVLLLHVIPSPSPIIDLPHDAEMLDLMDVRHEKEEYPSLREAPESEKMLTIAAKLSAGGIDTTVIIAQNDEAAAIIEECEKQNADMIMLGSHGHGALFHLLVGSVSEEVIRRASCPVIIVPSKMS